MSIDVPPEILEGLQLRHMPVQLICGMPIRGDGPTEGPDLLCFAQDEGHVNTSRVSLATLPVSHDSGLGPGKLSKSLLLGREKNFRKSHDIPTTTTTWMRVSVITYAAHREIRRIPARFLLIPKKSHVRLHPLIDSQPPISF